MMALLTLNFALTLGKHFCIKTAYFSTISYYLKINRNILDYSVNPTSSAKFRVNV